MTAEQGTYASLLESFDLAYTLRGPWAMVGKCERVQGWKLHLSSVPGEAEALLRAVVPLLKECGASFKVARDAGVLAQLNEGALGATQVGKFMTIYPSDDEQARRLAVELAERTRGLRGPVVVTDLRLGDVVYARYGGFNPVVVRDRLGQLSLQIQAPDGSWRPDRYQVPFVPPEGVPNPFEGLAYNQAPLPARNGSYGGCSQRLLGPGYLLVSVIKEHAKGAVFLAIDVRSQDLVAGKVIKQGRQYCMWDEHGRDMRTRLRRQGKLHATLASMGLAVPAADSYFEHDGDGYLPLEYIEGVTIESRVTHALAGRPWNLLPLEEQIRLLTHLDELAALLERMHSLGYVHRDVSASNVWIGADGRVYLLDLELAHAVDDPEPAFGLGTPGFMSPEQKARQAPAFADDIFSLGCVSILVFTGLDPRRVLKDGDPHLPERLMGLAPGVPQRLVEAAAQCVRPDPAERPALAEFRAAVRESLKELQGARGHREARQLPAERELGEQRAAGHGLRPLAQRADEERRQRHEPWDRKAAQAAASGRGHPAAARAGGEAGPTEQALRGLIVDGARGLLEANARDEANGLWLSVSLNSTGGRLSPLSGGYFELRRSAHRGVAGVVYAFARLARLGYRVPGDAEAVSHAVAWLLACQEAPDIGMPGLYFGDAGVAVALAESVAAGLIADEPGVRQFIANGLKGELDWPDITHGAAGQGIAALVCGDLLREQAFAALAHRCADYLMHQQREDGSWAMPPGVDGLSGQILTGFAHGVAGMVYFLAEYAHRFQDGRAEESWRRGAAWLVAQAEEAKGGKALQWRYSDTVADRWRWWCHGSPGIALAFLRLYELTGETRWAVVARKALRTHDKEVRAPNLSQCHGLSGLGEIYLEAYRVLGEREWRDRAAHIAATLYHLRRTTETGAVSWLVEEPHVPTADLMVGCGGVLHFLMRFAGAEQTVGFPLLLDPVRKETGKGRREDTAATAFPLAPRRAPRGDSR